MSQELHPVPAPISKGARIGGGSTLAMGVLNITPDSFSDGGRWFDVEAAVAHALLMSEQGASIIDVGGESTRPGASRVTPEQEWARIAKVVDTLVQEGLTVSVDTVNSQTARNAAEVGVSIINDVSGGVHDPDMARVCAESGLAMVVQHWRGFPSDPSLNQNYADPVSEVVSELESQVERVLAQGLPSSSIILDPGLGFALSTEDSWKIVESLDAFTDLGYPVLVGASRKRFVKERYGTNLLMGTLDVTKASVEAGAWGVRVHDVAENVDLIRDLESRRANSWGRRKA